MSTAERVRACRDRRRALGRCIDCARPSAFYRCLSCAVAHASRPPALLRVMARLAENRCVQCGDPKSRYRPWYCEKCRSQAA